jgi:site-specific DNA-methyltransferase (adenine-specific)
LSPAHVLQERYPPRRLDTGPATLLHADAITALRHLAARPVRPTLVYMDPPFAVGRVFELGVRVGDQTWERPAYDDRLPDGFQGYVDHQTTLIQAIADALDPAGSLLLHCDHRASPYLAMACDKVLGMGDRLPGPTRPGFRNELIWTYGLGGSSPAFWPRKHDTIFWYTRGNRWFFQAPRVAATSARMKGQTKKATDVLDVPTLNNMAHERTGYPTQKPLELLRMLIGAHSQPGDLVVDPCCGSGTTGVAAVLMGRAAVLSDLGRDAIAFARTRLLDAGASVHLQALRKNGEAAPLYEVASSPPPDVPVAFAALGQLDHAGTFSASAWNGAIAGSVATDQRAWLKTSQPSPDVNAALLWLADGTTWAGPWPPASAD